MSHPSAHHHAAELEGLMIHQRQRAGVKNKNQSHRRSSFKCAQAFSCRPNVLSQPRMPRFSVPIRFVFSVCVSLAWCRKEVSNASCISSIIMIKFICNYSAEQANLKCLGKVRK